MKTTKPFPFVKQPDAMDCGPACLTMIAAHYGRHYTLDHLREQCFIGREGVSLLGISKAARHLYPKTVSYISTIPAPDDGKLREVRIAFSLSSTASIQPDDVLEGRIILSEMPVIKKFLQSVGISC